MAGGLSVTRPLFPEPAPFVSGSRPSDQQNTRFVSNVPGLDGSVSLWSCLPVSLCVCACLSTSPHLSLTPLSLALSLETAREFLALIPLPSPPHPLVVAGAHPSTIARKSLLPQEPGTCIALHCIGHPGRAHLPCTTLRNRYPPLARSLSHTHICLHTCQHTCLHTYTHAYAYR